MPEQIIPANLIRSPAFWMGFLHAAAHFTEQEAPDYTWAHKIASVVDTALGNSPVSTPSPRTIAPVGEALAQAGQTIATAAAAAVVKK